MFAEYVDFSSNVFNRLCFRYVFKFSLAVKRTGHELRELNDMFIPSSRTHYQADFNMSKVTY